MKAMTKLNEMSTHFYNTYSLQITIYKTHNIYEL